MILICYDGSDDARAAIEYAGRLLQGQPATVLVVWRPFAASPPPPAPLVGFAHMEEIDDASLKRAERNAAEGAKLAREAGLEARPRICSQETTTADAILSEAEVEDAQAIVMGSRGLTGLKSLLSGERLPRPHTARRSDRGRRAISTGGICSGRSAQRQRRGPGLNCRWDRCAQPAALAAAMGTGSRAVRRCH